MKKMAKPPKHDWKRFDAMTAKQRQRAGLSDPDALPLTPNDFKRMRRTPRAKIIRRALGLTQQEFAARLGVPVETIRNWEQGKRAPRGPARALLAVIAHAPDTVFAALAKTLA